MTYMFFFNKLDIRMFPTAVTFFIAHVRSLPTYWQPYCVHRKNAVFHYV